MDSTETPEDKKARLIAEARRIKAPFDIKWDVTEIEAAVAKKKAQLAAQNEPAKKAEPAKVEEAAEEGDDEEAEEEGVDYEAIAESLQADLAAERAAHAVTRAALEATKGNLRETAEMLRLRTEDLDAVNLDITEYRLKFGMLDAGPNVDKEGNPVAAPAATAPAQKPTASGATVKVRVTKKGHDQIHTGDGVTRFKWNDEIEFPVDVAKGLEDRGFAEIQE